jgi:uncharacterized protein (TIGR03086 family)
MTDTAGNTTEIADRYRRLAGAFADRIAAVPADRWADVSPCDGWTARDVVRHVVDSQGIFLRLVGREPGPLPDVDADPAAAWDAARAPIQAGLDDPELAAAEFDGMFGRSTFAAAVDTFLGLDLVVHGWDLARATGQDETIDPADLDRALASARGFGDALRGPGVCGPELEVAPDADAQTRTLAFLGRRA